MGKVDELMELIFRHGTAQYDLGYARGTCDDPDAAIAAEDSVEMETELRATLTACVAEWRMIDDDAKTGAYFWLSNGFNMRVGFWRNGPQFECNGSVGGGWADMLGAESMGRTDLHFLPTIYQRLPILPAPPTTEGETK